MRVQELTRSAHTVPDARDDEVVVLEPTVEKVAPEHQSFPSGGLGRLDRRRPGWARERESFGDPLGGEPDADIAPHGAGYAGYT